MEREDKDYVFSNHKFPFSWWNIFERYFILIAPLGICFITLSMFFGGFKFEHIYQNNFINSFFLTAVIGLSFGIWLTIFIWRRIESEAHFKVIDLPHNMNKFVVENMLQRLGWTIASNEENEIVATTKTSSFSWGEIVTLLFDNNKVLLNSRPVGMQPFTIYRDKINYRKLLTMITEYSIV